MKTIKTLAILCVLLLTCFVVACDNSSEEPTETQHEHAYSEWSVTKTPTCTTDGIKERDCSCGDIQTTSLPSTGHKYGNWEVKIAATCLTEGSKERTCTACGEKVIETVNTTDHTYAEWIIDVAATCISAGEKHADCTICGYTKIETIAQSTVHNYDEGIVTQEPTCSAAGSKTLTCTVCAKTSASTINALGHSVNASGQCTRCGLVTLNMTEDQIAASKAVESMSYSVTEYSDEIYIKITLKDSNDYTKQVPVYVDVKIIDDDGTVLYSKTLIKKASQDKVVVDYKEITTATTNTGTLYYTVYNDYVSFAEKSKDLTKIPWTVYIELPTLPTTIYYSGYSDSSSCYITNITYEVSGDDVYFYFTGEKTYDKKGSGYSNSCKIGWKLYDSDGYVIADGTVYTTSLKVGEKFKDAKVTVYDVIEQGKTYQLVISNVS